MNLSAFSFELDGKRNGQKSGSAGFTLVELVVCMAVLAILCGIAAPSFNQYMLKSSLKSAAFQLCSDLIEAKSLAIKTNRSCQVILDPKVNQYSIAINGRTVSLDNYAGAVRFTTDPGGSVPFSDTLTFTGRGLCNPGGQVFLTNAQQSDIFRIRTSGAGGISAQIWDRNGGTWN
jgi:prepilin-type N-terminal cleavage/methylation domain-containing protein